MSGLFAKKLQLVLKVLSMSRARLAADLGVDKSVVGRWVSGAVQPSAHNLSRLSTLIAERMPGFTALDWDRTLPAFAELLGADLEVVSADGFAPLAALPLPQMDQFLAATALRGAAYEGFFRSTRPYVLAPGRFVHDHGMIRRDANGLLRLKIGTGGTVVEGWMLPHGNQLFAICIDLTSGAVLFGIFNGVGTARAEVVDGLVLAPALDAGRTPTAHAMVFERIGDLGEDAEADDRRFADLAGLDPVAPESSVPDALRKHLLGDFGPAAAALGGDMLLRLPLDRSLARGPAYRERPKAAE
jgi:transcriptional regulator with XRE-family HTH domain